MMNLFFLIFIGVQLLHSVVLAFAIQQSEVVILLCILPLFWISFPFRSLQSIEYISLCYTVCSDQSPTLYIISVVYICQLESPNSLHSPFPLGIHMLCVCVSISALQIRSSMPFVQVPCICIRLYDTCFSLSDLFQRMNLKKSS